LINGFSIFEVFEHVKDISNKKGFCIVDVPLISLSTLKHIYTIRPMNLGIYNLIALGYTNFILANI
jgi:hypothetical protein